MTSKLTRLTIGCIAICTLYALSIQTRIFAEGFGIDDIVPTGEDSAAPAAESTPIAEPVAVIEADTDKTTTLTVPLEITAEQFYILKLALDTMRTVFTNADSDKTFCLSVLDSLSISDTSITDILTDTKINPSTKMTRIDNLVLQHANLIGKIADPARLPTYINSCGTYTYMSMK